MIDAKQLLGNIDGNGLVGKMLGGMATKNFAAGLLTGGVATSLLGGGKNTLETAAKVGGLALLGTLAYKAYGAYQRDAASGQTASVTSAVKQGAHDMISQGKSLLGTVLGQPAEPVAPATTSPAASPELSMAVIRAMIGAAKADGKVDDAETQKILGHLQQQGIKPEEESLLLRELANTPAISDIAAAAKTPHEAAEIYLAALLVCDSQCAAEQRYLAELAAALKLDAAFTSSLQQELLALGTVKAA